MISIHWGWILAGGIALALFLGMVAMVYAMEKAPVLEWHT